MRLGRCGGRKATMRPSRPPSFINRDARFLYLLVNMASLVLYATFISFILCSNVGYCKHDHPVPTYFGRLHPNGTIVDVRNPTNRLEFNFHPKPSKLDQAAALKVSPSLIDSGDDVEVSWSGVSSPSAKDVVVLYCPPDAEPDRYLDFIQVDSIATYSKGYGEFRVVLWNLRKDCQFRYYKDDNYTLLVAQSNVVAFRGGAEVPLQGHLALTGNPSEMRVMWVSGTKDTPTVHYGSDPSIPLVARGNVSKTYSASDMCASPANGVSFVDPGFIHDVLLTNLKPGMLYFYSYGSDKIMSPVRRFKTAPPIGSPQKFTALVYGDMGVSPVPRAYKTAAYATQEAMNGSADFVFHNGDISYARGYAYIWEQWHAIIEPYATLIPYMVGIGNHEQDHIHGGTKDPSGAPGEGFHPWWAPGYGTDSGGECGVPMYYRFHMPDNGNSVWWYSFDYGSVHFIMMSTEHNFTQGSRQYEWMEHDLKNVNRSSTPWVVLAGHRAMYTSQKQLDDYIISLGMKKAFDSLLYKYKVDLAFWAHYHSYERTCAVYNDRCTPGATVHIVVGTAGKDVDIEDYFHVDWSLFHENDYGYGRLTQANRSALHWEWVENESGVVKDHLWLIK